MNEDTANVVPWVNEEENSYGVALNGSTLQFLHDKMEKYDGVLLQILIKAQVYARMTPDGKAMLVEML